MKINAYAKINLGLDVLRRRPDGYHEVRMVMQTVGICDELSIERTADTGIYISTDRDDLPVNEDNLIHKAARLMMDEYGLTGGIKVALKKNIPVAAGLAGGSTDAAAVLVAMNKLYDLGLDMETIKKAGVKIGADVPYCIMGGTALSEGIGEILTPIGTCPDCHVLLAKPPVSVSTAYVYGHLQLDKVSHPDIDGIIKGIKERDLKKTAACMGNVLESVTVKDNPVIEDIKSVMKQSGALSSLMSGSGPTVFGLFDDEAGMNRAYEELVRKYETLEIFRTSVCDPERY